MWNMENARNSYFVIDLSVSQDRFWIAFTQFDIPRSIMNTDYIIWGEYKLIKNIFL